MSTDSPSSKKDLPLKEKLEKFIELFLKYNHYDRQQGLVLKTLENGEFSYFLSVDEKHLSSPGVCHGGVISGLMDATLGLAALIHAVKENQICSTVEFKINYLGPAHLGDQLQGIGKLEFTGQSLVVTTADIINVGTQKLIAKGMGTFNLYPLSKRAKHYDFTA